MKWKKKHISNILNYTPREVQEFPSSFSTPFNQPLIKQSPSKRGNPPHADESWSLDCSSPECPKMKKIKFYFFLSQWILNWSYWSNNNNNIHTDLLLALVRPLKRSVNATAGKWEDFCKVWLRQVRFPARQWCQLLSQATLVANNGISSFNSLLPVREKGVEGRWRLKVDVVVHLNYRRVGTK